MIVCNDWRTLIFTFRRKAIDRWEGVLFLVIYIGYIWQTVR